MTYNHQPKFRANFLITIVVIALVLFITTFTFASLKENQVLQESNLFARQLMSVKHAATAFFAPSITVADLQSKYAQAHRFKTPKVRILIVPGHEPNFGGTSFGGVNERDLVVDIAQELGHLFENNPRYDVVIARGKSEWHPDIGSFFESQKDTIWSFVANQKALMREHVQSGDVEQVSNGIVHNKVSNTTALHLYGLNKWANENDIDITLHLHLNDHPRRNTRLPGTYEGFSIYVPESQFSNAQATHAVAENIRRRLLRYNNQSTLTHESAGIIESQDLIAVGSYNTSEAASMLIEYAYIYEPKIMNQATRNLVLKDFAFQTYLGIQDFFGSGNDINFSYDTVTLPYEWKATLSTEPHPDTYALQIALTDKGYYPPPNSTFVDCPITGRFGPCTKKALVNFQKAQNIVGEDGVVGEKTRGVLNAMFGIQPL